MSNLAAGPPKKRRAHRKSRAGCNECKRRRIKVVDNDRSITHQCSFLLWQCGEESPQCANCVRYDVSCVYPSTKSGLRATSAPAARSHPSPTSQPSPGHPISQNRSPAVSFVHLADSDSPNTCNVLFDLKALALLHHWTLETSTSILHAPQVDHFWQRVFPSIGFKNAYVIHSILSIAALHDAHLHPENRTTRLCDAAHYHVLALGGFRDDIDSIGAQNSDAIFASGVLAFMYAFMTFGQISGGQYDDIPASRTSTVLGADWIPLLRGLQPILAKVGEQVRSGPLRSLIQIGNYFELDPDVHGAVGDEQLCQLKELWSSSSDAAVYDETLLHLRLINTWMQQFEQREVGEVTEDVYNRDWSGPFIWLAMAPEEYFQLQSQRRPEALILFAHYGVLLHRLNNYWWMQGCGKSIVQVVDECLGPYWALWMVWPKEAVAL